MVNSDLAEEPIHLALLMPFSGRWDGGNRIAGAAAAAIETVNADKALLPGYVLQPSRLDHGCTVRISYFSSPDPRCPAMPLTYHRERHMSTHVYTHVYVHVYTYVCTHLCTCVCTHVYTHVCTDI